MKRVAIGFGLGFGLAVLIANAALAQRAGPVLPGGNSKSPVNVDAAKLEYFDKEQKAVYSGGVVARQGEATMRASTLTVIFERDPASGEGGNASSGGGGAGAGATGNQVKRIEATGPVTVVEKERVGTGDRGIYERAENKVYLIGNPTLSECGNVVKGDKDSRLIYDLTNNRAQITGRVSSTFVPGGGNCSTNKPAR
ncbi:LptA/OstA family protein [Methylocella sp. CPCC 101449]|uniref:LptA/OstA family protein n=1 Tax=Methylocella sp. CPCC 101449 TaxID=2987531 RepID=UPI00288DC56E|nr:LptA/OstA family protein [Methylocella sp. CPCC 101449]MDT2019797.1 organic solvent tolerance protein OstA [Methylocella sp. CPCC 101449]